MRVSGSNKLKSIGKRQKDLKEFHDSLRESYSLRKSQLRESCSLTPDEDSPNIELSIEERYSEPREGDGISPTELSPPLIRVASKGVSDPTCSKVEYKAYIRIDEKFDDGGSESVRKHLLKMRDQLRQKTGGGLCLSSPIKRVRKGEYIGIIKWAIPQKFLLVAEEEEVNEVAMFLVTTFEPVKPSTRIGMGVWEPVNIAKLNAVLDDPSSVSITMDDL